MNRRNFLIKSALSSLVFALPGFSKSKKDIRPNIIIICTDDQGYGQLSVFRDQFTDKELNPEAATKRYTCNIEKAMEAAGKATPNIGLLASEGIRFTDAYTASPLCGPSRAALLTSRYPQRYGIYCNADINDGLPVSETILAELLKKEGYKNAMIGKWHLGKRTIEKLPVQTRDYHKNSITGCIKEHHPLNRGFHYYFGFNSSGTTYYDSPSLFRNFEQVKAKEYITDEFTSEAVSFIQQNKENPFFLYLAYSAPHIPLEEEAPGKYLKRFSTGNKEVDNYYASIAAVDDGIGAIMAELKKQILDDNTIIFFLSDNGSVVDAPLPLNGPFRGYKGQLWQGGCRIPMIMRFPKNFIKNRTYKNPVSAMDIMPTALAAAGCAVPDVLQLDGVNLIPFLDEKENNVPHKNLFWAGPNGLHWGEENKLFWEQYHDYIIGKNEKAPKSEYSDNSPGITGVRSGAYMLRYLSDRKKYQLFNIDIDPAERHNVAESNQELVKKLKEEYTPWIRNMKKPNKWDENLWRCLME